MSTSDKIKFHLPYPLFDTHFHAAHMVGKGLDSKSLLAEALSKGLVGAVDIATGESEFSARLAFVQQFENVYLSAGIHPSSVSGPLPDRLAEIDKQAGHPKVVAIGETGLDSYRDYSPAYLQEESFRFHLELAARLDKPVIIHNREADERVLSMVSESSCRRGVFHCFSSDWDTAKKALDLGYYISFAGNVTFKSNGNLREVAKAIPIDRLLLETDAPFLSPMPRRGRPNHPGHIGYTLEVVSEARHIDPSVLAETILNNSQMVFRIGSTKPA